MVEFVGENGLRELPQVPLETPGHRVRVVVLGVPLLRIERILKNGMKNTQDKNYSELKNQDILMLIRMETVRVKSCCFMYTYFEEFDFGSAACDTEEPLCIEAAISESLHAVLDDQSHLPLSQFTVFGQRHSK